jgi:hypothetical protein
MMGDMMANLVDNLAERVKGAETELRDLDAKLVHIQQRRAVLARYLDVAHSLLDMERQQVLDGGMPIEEPTAGKRFEGKSITVAAAELLLEANRPLHVKEIWKGITEGGVASKAQKPLETLTSRLLRDKRFINIGSRTFKLAAWDGSERDPALRVNNGREAATLKPSAG